MRIDVRGEVCPYPMMQAVDAMKEHKGDGEIVLVTDHAPALDTIEPQATRLGYHYSVVETGSPEWTITLRPTSART